MTASGDPIADLNRVAEALLHAGRLVKGIEDAESARQCKPAEVYTPLRALIEQAEKATERIRNHVSPAVVEPCIPSADQLGQPPQ